MTGPVEVACVGVPSKKCVGPCCPNFAACSAVSADAAATGSPTPLTPGLPSLQRKFVEGAYAIKVTTYRILHEGIPVVAADARTLRDCERTRHPQTP